jgi:adenylate cyclase
MAIDPIIDPFRTCLLVYGNMCATTLTARKGKNDNVENFLPGKSGISQDPVLREQRVNLDLPPAQLPVVKNWFWRMRIFKVKYVIIFINVISLVFSAGIILSSMWISSEKNARDLSEALINEIQGALSIRLVNYFDPVAEMNNRTSYLLSTMFPNPIESPEGEDALFGYYGEILRTNQRVKMAYYADTHGNLMMLNRMEDGSFSKRTVRNNGETITTTWNHANVVYYGNYNDSVLDVSEGYDPRKRGWYLTAQEQRKPAWTPVYIFATDHLPGFTSVVPLYDNKGILSGVSAMDITVDEISRFLATMHPTPGTKIALIDNTHNLVAFQTRTEADLNKLFVEVVDEKGVSAFDVRKIDMFPEDDVRSILGETLKRGGGSCTVKYNGERFRSVLVPTPIGHGLELLIGIIIPENDIIGNMKKSLFYVTLFSMAILVIIIISASLFSNSIARPMQRLAEEMAKVRNFQLDSVVAIPTALIEITNIHEAFEGMRTGLRNFKRYVPAALVAQLINEEIDAKIGGEKRELSIFFSDIANFTSIAEKTSPEELMRQLRVYFKNVSKAILDNKGTIDKYIGDSIMAFWGAPVPSKNHAEMACRSAVRIQAILQSISRKWLNVGKEPFYTRIGIHTGEVIVGNVGYEERLSYTVLGDSVNLASRLEGVNKMYDTRIIVSQDTWNQCGGLFEFRRLDKISVKGRHEGIMIYELYSEKGEIEKSQRKLFAYYEKGLEYYFNRNFSEALKYFDAVLKYQATDGPSRVMRERCLRYKAAPPPEGWNGTFVLNKK